MNRRIRSPGRRRRWLMATGLAAMVAAVALATCARARRGDAPGALGSLRPGVARMDRAHRASAGGGPDAGAVVISPRPGQSVEPTVETPLEHWWPALPWRTGVEYPIVADHGD